MEDKQTKEAATETTTENPAQVKAVTSAPMPPMPVAVTDVASESAAAKPAEAAVAASEPLVANPGEADLSATESAPKSTSSPKPAESWEQNSEKSVPERTRSRERRDSLALQRTRSMGVIMKWSLSTYFDFNPAYLLQFRGLTNLLHIFWSLVVIILLATSCRLYAGENHSTSDGFFCKSPETFLFVMACSSFLTSVLYFFCCLLSKRTESLLFHTTLEVSYFIMYSVLYIIAGCAVMVSGDRSDFELNAKTSYDYKLTYAAGALGLMNGLFYGASAIAFFVTHRFRNTRDSSEESDAI